ncbi:receptor-type tyrosine-protein phosphatase H-like [Mantella aurantiaca]
MAFHYIISGRCKPDFLLLTVIICLCGSRVIAQSGPSIIDQLQNVSVTDNTIVVQWKTLSSITHFKVLYTNGKVEEEKNVTNTNYTITNLLPGMNYNITVYSVNGTNTNYGSMIQVTTLPSVVKGLNISNISTHEVTVSWTKSSDPNGLTYTYTVRWQGQHQADLKTNSTVVRNLQAGSDYSFVVYAVTNNGVESLASDVKNTTTLPSVVQDIKISNISTHAVTVSWRRSNDTNESTYIYTVEVQGQTSMNITNLKANSTVVENLMAGSDYSFKVYAVTDNGVTSPPSDVAITTTLPSVVEGLTISNISAHQVTVSWKKSSDPNESTYTYTVEWESSVNQTGLKTNSTVVPNLKAGTDYSFTVFAVTKNAIHSQASDVAFVTTQPSVVEGLTISNISAHQVTVSWTKSSDPNESTYTYTVKWESSVNQTGLKTNSTVVPNLEAGTNYNFTVFAVTKNEIYSQASDVAFVTTRPSEVLYFNVSAVLEESVNLTWTFPKDKNVNSYTYTVEIVNTAYFATNIHENHTVLLNLLPGENYSFTIYAVTQNKVNSSSYPAIYTTTMPSIVPKFMVASKTNNSMILNWTLPDNINVKTYTYTVQVTNVNFNNTIPNIKDNFIEVKNLFAGETYNFTIYTVTINGVRSFKYPFFMDTTMPNEPRSLAVNVTGITEIFIVWTPPGDSHASSYEYNVIWHNVKVPGNKGMNTTKDTQFNIRNLFPGNLYTITVTSEFERTLSVNAVKNVQTNPVSTQNFAVLNTTNTTASLQWYVPSYSNSNVDGYLVIALLNGINVYNQTTRDTYIVVDSLKPGYIYEISVRSFANNTISQQKRSLSQLDSTYISYSTPETSKAETAPDPVMNPTCSKVDGYQISVEFKCPVGNYSEIQVLVNNKPRYNCSCDKGNVISGLQPAKEYFVEIMTLGTNKNTVTFIFKCYTDSTGVIVGSVLGILIFLLLIGLIAFFVLKKRRSKDNSERIPITPKGKRFHTISKERFQQHYENNHANSDFGFAEEYQELSSVGTAQSKRAAELPENRAKNRFTNVLPYEHSRVKLTTINESATTDYINANFMPGYNSTKEFIASQGPLPNTTADFWRMIWEHHVNTIVMLTNCMENGRVKCEHYWPLDYTPCTYGDITVTVTSETILSEWTTRDFSVKNANQPGVQYVRHFHFTAWPDHGVPDSTSSVTQFRNLVREHMDQRKSNGPTVVHCSAGVGRTGTLIALDYLIQQMETEHRIGIYGCVEKMRMNRGLMVQTEEQYIFLNKCMLDLIEQPPDENIYENQTPTDLIYENATVVRNFQRENA